MVVAAGSCGWRPADKSQRLAGEAVDIAAGEAHIAVASLMGDTYAWGQNHHGQCARDPGGDSSNCFLAKPTRACGSLEHAVVCRVACGRYHTAVLSVDGTVYTFGAGLSGQLGRRPAACGTSADSGSLGAGSIGARGPTRPPLLVGAAHSWRPEKVILDGSACSVTAAEEGVPILIVQVVCGDEHTICLTDMGRVIAFGSGENGQLGLGGVRSHRTPVPVRTLTGVQEIAAGSDLSLFRGRGARVFLAGKNPGSLDDSRLLRQIIPAR